MVVLDVTCIDVGQERLSIGQLATFHDIVDMARHPDTSFAG